MPFKVSIRDANGQITGAGSITIALATNTSGGALLGTATRAAVNGVATFDDLAIVKPGQGYTITANSPGMASATSSAFTLSYSADENETVSGSNDAPGGAVAITPNVPMFGNLTSIDDVDYYKFHATAGQILSVSSYATRLDLADWDTSLELKLFAPDGTTELQRMSALDWGFASIDNGFAAIRIPADGDYFLACDVDANGSLGLAAAKYALVVKLANAPAAPQLETEPAGQAGQNDSIATAQAISPGLIAGQYQSPGAMVSTSDSDFYKVTIDAPTRVHFEIIGGRNGVANNGAAWDAMLELQDKNGTVVWRNDDTTFLDPAIDYVVTTPGDYYVRVTRVNDADLGTAPYLLSYDASAYAASAPASANTTAATAVPISYGQTVSSAFTVAGGQQFFVFNGNAGDLVRLWVDDKSSLQGSQLQMDPSVAADAMLLGTDGVTALAAPPQPFTSQPPAASELNVRQTILQTSGPQFVRVSSPAGGSFGIRLERIAAAGSAPGWISAVLPSGATPADNKNHHTVHAEEGQLVTVSLFAGPGASQNSASPFGNWGSALLPTVQVVQVLDSTHSNTLSTTSGDRLGLTNYAESMLRPEAMLETSFRAPTAGNYDVVVSDANGQGGAAFFYALQIWKNQ
jgi:hypothetical protein